MKESNSNFRVSWPAKIFRRAQFAARRRMNRAVVTAIALFFSAGAWALSTEYVPTTTDSYPFFSALTDLGPANYVEDEYLVAGTANIYEYDGDLNVQVQAADVPYKTRIMIRRPAAPEDFNGVVVFEMINPTATFDIDFIWQYTHELLMREGYIWVGMTIREDALNVLKGWDPARYGTLSLVERGLSYDAFGDIAALMRDPLDPENPLANYNVTHVLGSGYSQSEDWLTTFSNELHDSKLAWNGVPAFDGYLGSGGNGAAREIWSGDPDAEYGAFYLDDRKFNEVNAPYFRIQSETEIEVFSFPASDVRQPDSNIFRQWEVAGTSHADGPSTAGISATINRDFGFPLPPCDAPTGDVAMAPYISAALYQLTRWVKDGIAPPPGLYLELNGPNDVKRDANGNALGGIRIPEVEVPLGTHLPFNSGPPGTPCFLASSFFEFPPEDVAVEYPSHGNYVSRVGKAANDLRKQGYLLAPDAETYKETAAGTDVGK